MKKLLILVAVLILGTGAWFTWRGRLSVAATGNDGGGVSREGRRSRGGTTSEVKRRTLTVEIKAVGDINPANMVAVKAEVSGKIQAIPVTTGQNVPKGDLLVSLDDTDLLTERAAALTDINGAKLQLEKARRDFERLKELYASRLVSREVFDNAQTEVEQSEVNLEKTQRRLQTVEDKLKKIRIPAPFDGTVLSISVNKGQVVSGATSVSNGTELMTFADLNEMIIRAHINQVDITKLQVGQDVNITVDSLPGVKLTGHVVLIAPIATLKNNVKGFSVDVLIDSKDARIRPGMNANLEFPVVKRDDVLTVPIAAVFAQDDDKVVYVKEGAGFAKRTVTVGASNFRYVEIQKGVTEGEVVSLERPVEKPGLR